VKLLRSTLASGSGQPGAVIDDKLTIACGEGALRIVELQRAGRQPMNSGEFLRGTPLPAGTLLS
jgi:methionyl-tRNA formyltransferase